MEYYITDKMKHLGLKDFIKEGVKKHILIDEHVTTMTYDVVTKDDTNINHEIKDYLAERGWAFTIPEQTVKSYNRSTERTEKDAPTPNTTAWKAKITPDEACGEFYQAIVAYNTNHSIDNPIKIARGNAFAVRDNEYKALKIE